MGNKGHEGVREIKGKVQVIYRSHSPQRSYHLLLPTKHTFCLQCRNVTCSVEVRCS